MSTSIRSAFVLRSEFTAFVEHYQKQLSGFDALWISDISSALIKNTPYKQAFHKLGQETDLVVFDANNAIDVNALGAICGCIRGGGTLILLLPPNDEHFKNSYFYQRLLRILSEHDIPMHSMRNTAALPLPLTSNKPPPKNETTVFTATPDQNLVIEAIKKVVGGHRNRPLVVTSDRGRGKSTALGMAMNELLLERSIKIIICAPAKAMVAPLLACAGQHDNLHYVAADELVSDLPEAGLLVIDEAGAIPVPLLSKLLSHYSRLVFATTLHGYEGNGRGFAIRFHEQLYQLTPQWRAIRLNDPIRWDKNDPLEALINDVLLLDAEPVEPDQSSTITPDKLIYKKLAASELSSEESLLRQLFGLLVIAHYQTRPSDLLQMLDAPPLSIHGMFYNETLISACIVSHEGGLDKELASAIYRGERRPKGHLVPQILLAQMGLMEAASLKTDRIMRIATHPTCQSKKIASQLLVQVASRSGADYLSTSFGLSERLLKFWRRSQFSPAYIGLKREASSGYHSAVLLRPLNKAGKDLQQIAGKSFTKTLLALLGDTLKYYDAGLALQLLSFSEQSNANLCQQEIRDIKRFSKGQCSFASAIAALQHWLPTALIDDKQINNNKEAKLLIMRIIQHHNWPHCCGVLGFPGKQIAQQTLQHTVSALASDLSMTDVSKDGLTRR